MLIALLLFMSLMLSISADEQGSSIVMKTDKSGCSNYDESNLCWISDGYSTDDSGGAPTPETPPSPEGLNSTGNDNSTDPSLASTPQKQRVLWTE